MFTKLLTVSALLVSCGSSPINETVSEKNVVKREANVQDHFPDWVPFKNKHGDQLGEFVQVQKKTKVKKRLAPPVNFLLRAVADEGDEYYDKGAGESDSDDYFERRDWADLNRPHTKDDDKKQVNHSDISDIDGVVDIITKKPEPILAALESANKRNEEIKLQRRKILQGEEIESEEVESISSKSNVEPNNKERSSEEEGQKEEEQTEKPKLSPEEVKENEERKAKILSSVDALKQRHAEEQRQIYLADRLKEEILFRDQQPRGSSEEKDEDRLQQHNRKRDRKLTTKPDYDEYEDPNRSLEDKYKFNVLKSTIEEEDRPVVVRTTQSANPPKGLSNTQIVPVKLSVFRNPSLYMIDGEYEAATTQSVNPVSRGSHKFSSRYTSTPASYEDEKISFVPVDSKEEEPTLFLPKKKKNRRKKTKTTTESDSSVAETVTDNYKETTALDATDSLNTVPASLETTGTDVIGTTVDDALIDAAAINSDAISDAVPASSDNKKEEHENYDHKKGGEREHHSEHSEEHEEHGKKAYEGHHEDTKTAKGHHDKENHLGKYDDHGGVDKHHSEEAGHYGQHHHEEHGKKHAKYEESGKHSKGHSTKGSHDIHKKEEYEKKVEFFEEDGDSGEEERHGGYNHEKEHAEGGHFKHGGLKANHEHHEKGQEGHFVKGGHGSSHKGHKEAHGHDSHGKNGQKHFHKAGRDGGKKWIYHHGTPAKTANLVVIDRRGDQYYHGPRYYG